MRKYKLNAMGFVAVLLAVSFLAGCGKETVNTPDSTLPYVTSTTPASDAAGTALNPAISVTFSEAMNASTVNSTTFTVLGPDGPVTGTVALSGTTATFTPTSPLAAQNASYTATVSTGVKDLAGNAMNDVYNWTFTTMILPSVVSTTPAAGATGVAINQTLAADFLQTAGSPGASLNCATFTTATFTLSGPSGAVAGAVTCAGATAAFAPAALLAQNATYTATITTGAHNVAGNGMANPFVWSFTTGPQPNVIATVPASGATGVLPSQTISAAFSEAMNCSTLYSPAHTFTLTGPGGASVAGTVNCTGTSATFAPTAELAPNTVYTATVSSGADDAVGEPLVAGPVPNPWTFRTAPAASVPAVITTVPLNNATGVPTNQKIAATFSEAMNPATINNTTFLLTGPGGASVTSVVTYAVSGSIATLTPAANLGPLTTYVATITTGAQDLAGDALASNYAWTFTTGAAPDTIRPTVIATIPTNGATGVPTNQAASATFSKAMDPATINASTFLLTGPGTTPVTGFVTYAAVGDTATFTAAAPLLPSTQYTATLTTGAMDLASNALAANFVWTFTTATAPATISPTIVSTNPANASAAVPLTATVNATFSAAMDPLTITTATFQLAGPGGAAVPATVAYDAINFIATLTPLAPLVASTTYIATVTDGATNLAGGSLAAGAVPNPWSFTTVAVAGPPPPAVPLGTAALFGGFGGGSGMTNQGISTIINGNIGTTAVSTLITGFHDNGPNCIYTETPLNIGLVNGAIDTAPPPPTVGCPTEGTAATVAIANQAASDALTAYNDMVAFPNGLDVSVCPGCGGGGAGELGGRTLAPGIYKSASGSYSIALGDLTLDAHGDPNAFWVFQMATSLTVGTPSVPRSVNLINGAQAKNVFWQVGSAATINGILGGGTMVGTIISQSGVSISTAGVVTITTLNGRALALTGPVTIVNTVVNVPLP